MTAAAATAAAMPGAIFITYRATEYETIANVVAIHFLCTFMENLNH